MKTHSIEPTLTNLQLKSCKKKKSAPIGLTRAFLLFVKIFVFGFQFGFAQNYDPVLKALSRAEYEKGKKLLMRILDKKPSDPGAFFFMGQYFFDPFCPEKNLDSAYFYIQKASQSFQLLKPEDAKRIELNLVNGHEITLLKSRIELKAFQLADSVATEESYQSFIDKYPNSEQISIAVLKRDKIAYSIAQKENSYLSYAKFLDKYPKSIYAQEAHEKYEMLLYRTLTAAKTLEQYRNFIQTYPSSPYVEDAVSAVYELNTYTNSLESLADIVRNYPQSNFATKALYRLAYLYPDAITRFESHQEFKSIETLLKLDTVKIMAFWGDNDKFGFIDSKAKVVIEPVFETLNLDYLCKGTNEKFIITKNGERFALHNRLGKRISDYEFESIESENFGYVVVSQNDRFGLYHLGGFWILPCKYEGLEVVSNRALVFKMNGRFGLLTFGGDLIVEAQFEEVDYEEGSFILYKDGKCNYLSETNLFKEYKRNKPIKVELLYQSCKRNWNCILTQTKSTYEVFDPISGKSIIKNAQYCYPSSQGWLVKMIDRWTLHQPNGKIIGKRGYDSLILGEGIIAARSLGSWGITDTVLNEVLEYQYDSVILTAYKTAILIKGKDRFAYYKGYKPMAIPDFTSLKIKAFGDSDSQVFLIATLKNGKSGLWNLANTKLFAPTFDEISFTESPDLFIVRNGTLRGLVDRSGKWVLQMGFQGLIYLRAGWFATYKNGLFGLAHPEKRIVVQPQFLVQPKFYNDSLLIIKKQKLALFDGKKNLGNFEDFEQIEYWNDTSALVLHQNKWKIYDFKTSRFDSEYFDKYEVLEASKDETLLKTFRSSGFGILSNQRGRIVAEEFTGIKRLGSENHPIFLAEKHIPQAGIFVLLYYNRSGQILRRQVVSNPVFENFTCLD